MGNDEGNERGRLTAEQAMKMLKKENLEVTLEQAGKILEFLRILAGITVSNYLNQKDENSGFICESEYRRTGRKRIFPEKSGRNAKKVL